MLYLGVTLESVREIPEGTRIVAAVLDDDSGPRVSEDMARWVSARTMAHALDDLDSGIVVEALAMANWHHAHSFSPITGAPAESPSGVDSG
jgi:NAD+ diphosphatase